MKKPSIALMAAAVASLNPYPLKIDVEGRQAKSILELRREKNSRKRKQRKKSKTQAKASRRRNRS